MDPGPRRRGPQARGAAPLRGRRPPGPAPGPHRRRPAELRGLGPGTGVRCARPRWRPSPGGRPPTRLPRAKRSCRSRSTARRAAARARSAMPSRSGSAPRSSTPGSCTAPSRWPRSRRGSTSTTRLALGALARRAHGSRCGGREPDQTDRLETVLLDRRDVTDVVRTPRVDRAVSTVSAARGGSRRRCSPSSATTARRGDTVMVGRDIGTVVLPDATLKVFLTASTAVRAARRAAEMGRPDRTDEYLAEIERRDAADSGRAVAPLRKARRGCARPRHRRARRRRLCRRDRGGAARRADDHASAKLSSTWFYGPGSRTITGWRCGCLGGATIEGHEHVPPSGAYILVANHCSLARSADHRLGGRPHGTGALDPLHGQGGDATLAGHRLAGDALRRLLRAPRRGGPRRRSASRSRRLAAGEPIASSRRARARATGSLSGAKGGATLLAMRAGVPAPAGRHRGQPAPLPGADPRSRIGLT